MSRETGLVQIDVSPESYALLKRWGFVVPGGLTLLEMLERFQALLSVYAHLPSTTLEGEPVSIMRLAAIAKPLLLLPG